MSHAPKNKERGFTLIEVVIGLAICLILMGVAVSIFNVQRKSYSMQEQVTEMQQNVRIAMDMMVREIRMTGYDPTEAGFVGIGTNTTTLLQILADHDGNGTTTGTNEDITYRYYDANDATYPREIKRKTGGAAFQPFAENIDGCNFLYFDGNGIATTTASSIRQIRITVTGRTAKADPNFGYSYGTLTSLVIPENLSY
ncbi:MAG: prepilin-type N-terminal cleavage/methylation domain-containing protein [Candidatus Brocadia sp.]|nr:prepilin-type N-terminal cleavage/methylation domain-containing protein [Candidatus Brocadia sp.]